MNAWILRSAYSKDPRLENSRLFELGFLDAGAELVTTSWDILNGDAAPGDDVLLFDDNGAHPGMSCAERIARTGAKLEIVTPDRVLAPDIGGTNYPAYFRAFAEPGFNPYVSALVNSTKGPQQLA